MIPPNVRSLIRLALDEDWGRGDLSALSVPAEALVDARIIARENIVPACLGLVEAIFAEAGVKPERLQILAMDGEALASGQELLRLRLTARALLGIERTLLNFLQRSAGIATEARRFAEAILAARSEYGDRVHAEFQVIDTRKTVPGFRWLDKEAVRAGGLRNHRFGLDSGVLLKENHLRAAGGITKALAALHGKIPHGIQAQVEVCSEAEAWEAIAAGARMLLLDNFALAELAPLVAKIRARDPHIFLEASGEITLAKLAQVAASGVNAASVGALTHSVKAANLSLLVEHRG